MTTEYIIQKICSGKPFARLSDILSDNNSSSVQLNNLSGSAISAVAAGIVKKHSGVHLFILNESDDAAYMYNDLYNLLLTEKADHDNVLFLPSSYKRSSKYGRADSSNIVQRTKVLECINNIGSNDSLIIVSYPEAVAETVPAKAAMKKHMLQIKQGEKPGIPFIKEVLSEYGFERADFVYEPGQYAIRGGIVDIFSFSANQPYRIEFFGDEAESVRKFDINTQLSEENLDVANIMSDISLLGEQEKNISLFEYIPDKSVIWSEDHKTAAGITDNVNDNRPAPYTDEDGLVHKMPELISGKSFLKSISGFTNISFGTKREKAQHVIEFNTSAQPVFNKKFELLAENLSENIKAGYEIFIIAENTNQIERLRNVFSSVSKENISFKAIDTSLHAGFIDHDSKMCCYTDHQIFQRYPRYRIRGEVNKSNAITMQELTNLNVGDYIVHIDHGIGVFGGLVNTDVNGRKKEMVRLTYSDNDVIFVDLQGLHRISKYRGKDGAPPKIYKLGSGTWSRLKQSAKKKIKDIANELIALYAKRKKTEGFAYSPDSYLQYELEASFIYEDTPDQNKATKAVKADMEKPYPMDRLVCGDVGFGKTEVAIRAAFKAATDGKQVAVLVPTTILALQHYKSFKARLESFPVNIDFISRMKSAKEIKESLKMIYEGKTDIIIGTHRLLSKDVVFKDLGLLIIDEEQRFGVASKEKIRQKRVNVDTLTLTATPIPRTLQFSLLGARDLSIINTPPPNRLPIITEVHSFSEIIIKDAVDFEVQRGGQIFFIHNRINEIPQLADLIKRNCPGVKTVVAHGQMEGDILEEIMTDFVDGQYDVLIATTIIESGLDIPNANTIIINQAQNFGLSELHQLRGRVGRSNRKAYCYLLSPPPVALTPEAKRRLKAIEEFSDLGSGFNISMQDLDIRGAGNMLGGEQSGFIAEIGFETYQRILAEAINELHEENDEMPQTETIIKTFVPDCQIDSDIDFRFPDEYVSNKAEKLRLYRELDSIDYDKIEDFKTELIDRFGPIPTEAEELIDGIYLRHTASKLGFERIVMKNGIMFMHFVFNPQSAYYSSDLFRRIIGYIQSNPAKFKLKESDKLVLIVRDTKSMKSARDTAQKMEKSVTA